MKVFFLLFIVFLNQAYANPPLSYEDAKEILINNCDQCWQRNKVDLERGVSIMAPFVFNEDTPDYDKYLVARSYRMLKDGYTKNEELRSVFFKNINEIYNPLRDKIYKEIDSNMDLSEEEKKLYRIILWDIFEHESSDGRKVLLGKILQMYPGDLNAFFSLGAHYFYGANEKDKGIKMMNDAFEAARSRQDSFSFYDALYHLHISAHEFEEVERLMLVMESKGYILTKSREALEDSKNEFEEKKIIAENKNIQKEKAKLAAEKKRISDAYKIEKDKMALIKTEKESKQMMLILFYIALFVLFVIIIANFRKKYISRS